MERLIYSSDEIEAMSKTELGLTLVKLQEQKNMIKKEISIKKKAAEMAIKTLEGEVMSTNRLINLTNQHINILGTQSFKEKLFSEHGEGIPRDRLDKCYELAYEEGHSAGESEIKNYFIDYVELFR